MHTANKKSPEITNTEVGVNKFISAQDLKSLKKQDPFLYYSIPEVREATIRLGDEDVDMHQVALNGLRRYSKSCPASTQSSRTSETVIKIERCKRLSFECHTDLLLDLDDLSGSDGLGDLGKVLEEYSLEDDSCEEFLFKLLERSWFMKPKDLAVLCKLNNVI